MLTDARREKLFHLMNSTGRVYDQPEHRQIFEGILYRLRTGIPWRDLPREFGHWAQSLAGFIYGLRKVFLHNLFKALANLADGF